MGKPLITTDARGCRNVVRPGWGLVAPVRSASAIANAMLKLAASSETRAAMGAHNHKKSRELYNLDQVLAHVDEVYSRLLSDRGIDDTTQSLCNTTASPA